MNTFKTAFLGAALLVGATASASAADLGRGGSYKDAPDEYLPAITWSGLYFGVNLGAAFDDNEDSCPSRVIDVPSIAIDAPNCVSDNGDDTLWLAGLHVGYNWHRPNGLLLGLEGDVSFADDIDYLASIRGRIGYAEGATLFYATGGWALMGVEDNFGDDDTLNGWVAGVGIEHKLRQNVSIGLEGLYYSFDDDHSYGDDEQDFWSVRARLTYHLGGDAYQEALK